ncbi:MAG TPA: hypothetical protein GXX57_01130 [Firmicutes bacterium]|jgi:hypothetical protein|nr:hypothetical protein [Bacillota bacterium]
MKRFLMASMLICALVLGLTLAVSAQAPKNLASVYVYDFEDVKIGAGYARLFDGGLAVAVNVDGVSKKPILVNLTGIYFLPEFLENLKLYAGAGATYDVDAKATTGHALVGASFSYLFAEYQYGFGADADATIRGGLRIQF